MWTSPTRPPSIWMNAPYGVMRCTVPSTTAPTSRSAISSSFEPWGQGDLTPGCPNYPTGPGGRQYVEIGTRRTSAGGRLGRTVLRDEDERDLAGLDHAEAFPCHSNQIPGVVQAADPRLEPLVRLLEHPDLLPQAYPLG